MVVVQAQPYRRIPVHDRKQRYAGAPDTGSYRYRKHYHDVLIEPPPPGRRRRLRLANQLDEFEQLAGYLRGLKNSVMIGFEATGNYHRPLAYFLHR
jgi:transposase